MPAAPQTGGSRAVAGTYSVSVRTRAHRPAADRPPPPAAVQHSVLPEGDSDTAPPRCEARALTAVQELGLEITWD